MTTERSFGHADGRQSTARGRPAAGVEKPVTAVPGLLFAARDGTSEMAPASDSTEAAR
jgi:hypothetical protein